MLCCSWVLWPKQLLFTMSGKLSVNQIVNIEWIPWEGKCWVQWIMRRSKTLTSKITYQRCQMSPQFLKYDNLKALFKTIFMQTICSHGQKINHCHLIGTLHGLTLNHSLQPNPVPRHSVYDLLRQLYIIYILCPSLPTVGKLGLN